MISISAHKKLVLIIAVVLGLAYYFAYEVVSTTLGWKIYYSGFPCTIEEYNPRPLPFASPNVSVGDVWYAASQPNTCRSSQLEIIFSYVHMLMDFLPFLLLAYISALLVVPIYERHTAANAKKM